VFPFPLSVCRVFGVLVCGMPCVCSVNVAVVCKVCCGKNPYTETYVQNTLKVRVFPNSVGEPSDDGQCWPNHVKMYLYMFILNLLHLMELLFT
jgi:hypothetical protein